jgi:hypothetical protein
MRQHASAYVSIRQHASAYVSIRQHESAYVSMRQHTSAYAYAQRKRLASFCPDALVGMRHVPLGTHAPLRHAKHASPQARMLASNALLTADAC